MNSNAVLLMGPTASGKTDLAVSLCKRFPCDIISVDSALVYRGMDIGTAKPDAATLKRAPHRLIDICKPTESYSAARFRQDAMREISRIHKSDRVPLLVGGTMMYFRALFLLRIIYLWKTVPAGVSAFNRCWLPGDYSVAQTGE